MDSKLAEMLQPVHDFLACRTPQSWLWEAAKPENLPILLLDHLHCELKAAQSAAFLVRRYAPQTQLAKEVLGWLQPYEDFVFRGGKDTCFTTAFASGKAVGKTKSADPVVNELLAKMVLLIKEELHHLQQVWEIMHSRDLCLQPLSAARYANGLRRHIRTHEPAAFIDKLVTGAYIEARSCERFAALVPLLDDELARFYVSLLRSEARHYQDYLELARMLANKHGIALSEVEQRIELFGRAEAELITAVDDQFRFHSGTPVNQPA